MSWLSSLMHPGRPYQAAQDQMTQYYNQAQQGMQPYMQQGQQAGQQLGGAMQKLMDPAALQNEWTQGYEMSPQAKQAQQMASQQGLDAASSMGLMGSQPALQAIQGGASQIALNDRQRYLDDLMGKYQAGIGVGENMYGTGAGMASQSGQMGMNMGENAGAMQYGRNAAGGQMLGNLISGAGKLGMSYLTGGMGTGGAGSMRGMWSPTGG